MFSFRNFLRISFLQQHGAKSANVKSISLKVPNTKRSTLTILSSAGVGAGIFLSWLLVKKEVTERKSSLIPSSAGFEFLPCVSAATPVDVEEDEDINKGDPASKAREIRSLNMRKDHNFIADVVEGTAPAVVYIEIKDSRRRDYFGAPATLSNGSGFIVKEDGLILTNAHVVVSRPYARVHVKLYDGRVFEGYVEDVDVKADLATVRIPCKNLPVLRLGSSAHVRPGEWVVAMGSPLSLANTITVGVVSSINRASEELGIRGRQMEYIQTDAAITFGNSGGPLVNLDGEAVGINSMKVTAGISFAIPIDYGKAFLKAAEERKASEGSTGWLGLKKKHEEAPKRRYIGVTMLALTPQLIQELQMRGSELAADVTHGVLIWKVVLGSPAHNGGLRPGDVITSVNGKQVALADDVYKALESSGKLLLEVSRKREKLQLTIVPEGS